MTSSIKIFLTTFFLSLPLWLGINFFQPSVENFLYAQISKMPENYFVKIPQNLQKPKLELQAKAVLSTKFKMGENREGDILFEKNKNEILAIASLTKLMTALVILEDPRNYDFSRVVTVSKKAASQDDVPVYGNLKTGENFKIKKLLDLMLVYSSNDAAVALAEVIGLDNFVGKMNSKARELNLDNTHFVSPNGLDPEDLLFASSTAYFNYSTAEDLTTLSQYILKNYSLIFEISSEGGPYPTHNGISEISVPADFMILGGKTGNTDEAGGCILLVLASHNGSTIINVILNAPSIKERIEEMQKLIDWLAI